jgi:hypothetical protein
MHRPVQVSLSAGAPPTLIRGSTDTHTTVVHGLGVGPGSVYGQPAIENESAAVSSGAGAPARVCDGAAITVPPCGHIRTESAVSCAGITAPPGRRR